jgi:hypothetical protein
MRKEPTTQELFLRAIDRIDRRIQNPAYAGYPKDVLWDLRKSLFEQKTDEEQQAELDEMDYCLRNIDRMARRRRV